VGTGAHLRAAQPRRVQLGLNPSWQIETDHEKTSEVDVRFTAEGPDATRVELEHRNLDCHGQGWEGMRAAVGSPGGWSLEHFAEVAAAG
jgi:hypothetical protein